MNNETGLAILSAVLNGMSYPNRILTNEEDNSTAIDVKDLHKILLTGCYYPPEQGNKKDTPTAGIENCTESDVKNLSKENVELEDAGKSINIDVFLETMEGKPFPLTLKSTTTIAELKEMISSTKEIPPNSQRLIFAINLHDDRNFHDQSI